MGNVFDLSGRQIAGELTTPLAFTANEQLVTNLGVVAAFLNTSAERFQNEHESRISFIGAVNRPHDDTFLDPEDGLIFPFRSTGVVTVVMTDNLTRFFHNNFTKDESVSDAKAQACLYAAAFAIGVLMTSKQRGNLQARGFRGEVWEPLNYMVASTAQPYRFAATVFENHSGHVNCSEIRFGGRQLHAHGLSFMNPFSKVDAREAAAPLLRTH